MGNDTVESTAKEQFKGFLSSLSEIKAYSTKEFAPTDNANFKDEYSILGKYNQNEVDDLDGYNKAVKYALKNNIDISTFDGLNKALVESGYISKG
jgi:hypothetical protein